MIPEKEPWNTLAVDLIGPYTLKVITDVHPKTQVKIKRRLEVMFMTMIDPETRWFEMVRIWNKDSEAIALLVDRTWFA